MDELHHEPLQSPLTPQVPGIRYTQSLDVADRPRQPYERHHIHATTRLRIHPHQLAASPTPHSRLLRKPKTLGACGEAGVSPEAPETV